MTPTSLHAVAHAIATVAITAPAVALAITGLARFFMR